MATMYKNLDQFTFVVGSLRLDLLQGRAWHEDVEIRLTPQLFRLLAVLMLNKGRIIKYDLIYEVLTGRETALGDFDTENLPKVAIFKLRKLLKEASGVLIQTERNQGYRLLERHS